MSETEGLEEFVERVKAQAATGIVCDCGFDPAEVVAALAPELRRAQRVEELEAENERLRADILNINAHATPYGDIPGEPGWVGTYLLTAGALHRALGKIGHTAPSCKAEERAQLADELALRLRWAIDAGNDLAVAAGMVPHAREVWKEVVVQGRGVLARYDATKEARRG